jgi:hypothetical protein
MIFRKSVQIALAAGLALACLTGAARAQQQPSAAAIALSKELLEIKGIQKIFDPVLPGVVEQTKNLLMQTNFNLAKDLNEVATSLRTQLAPRRAEIYDEIARMYARRFTEQEIKDTLAFYKSPLGKKLLVEEPVMFEQSREFVQGWATKLSEEVMTKFRAEMKKKGHNL